MAWMDSLRFMGGWINETYGRSINVRRRQVGRVAAVIRQFHSCPTFGAACDARLAESVSPHFGLRVAVAAVHDSAPLMPGWSREEFFAVRFADMDQLHIIRSIQKHAVRRVVASPPFATPNKTVIPTGWAWLFGIAHLDSGLGVDRPRDTSAFCQ